MAILRLCFPLSYETHSAVKRSNAVLRKRMRSATYKSKINNGFYAESQGREEGLIIFTVSIIG